MASPRPYLRVWWLLAAISAAGCADRTGVLLEVTRDEATVPADIDSLRFFVGVEVDQSFVDDGDPAAEVAVEDGRDLLEDPYLFLLSPGDVRAEMHMMAVVVGFQGDQVVGVGSLSTPIHFIDGKVLGYPVTLQGTTGGSVVITETGCLIWNDGTQEVVISTKQDRDCDGDPTATDCDDGNPSVGHTSPETCDNGIDDDCDGTKDEIEDVDGDLVNNCLDCDDTDQNRFPGNPEVCDGVDNDCNAVCDDGALDGDEDTFTTCARQILEDGSCSDVSDQLNDCDDGNPAVHPFATETCDGLDNDCNEVCDDGFDQDGDLFTTCGSRTDVCDGVSPENVDCEPELSYANPGVAAESCDDADDDCDGVLYPDVVPCYVTVNSGEERCLVGSRGCDDGGAGWIGDCTPTNDMQEVPLALCDAYDLCIEDAPDPWACANQAAATTTYACTVFFPEGAPGSVCAPAAAQLPHSASGDPVCAWLAAPASSLPGYDVVLATTVDGSGGGPTSTVCQPLMVVRDTLVVPQAPDSWLFLQKQNGNVSQTFRVLLTPQSVAQCPANGLSCVSQLPPPG